MSAEICDPTRQVPALDFHSYLDTNVPIESGKGAGPSIQSSSPLDSILNVWASIDSCMINNDTLVDNSQFTHIIWTNCACNTEVQQYITRDGGHSWPRGEATPMGDPTSEFISANELMWSFFQNYTLACETTSINTASDISPLTIYPNPSRDRIRFEIDLISSSSKISIFNSAGIPVFNRITAMSMTLVN